MLDFTNINKVRSLIECADLTDSVIETYLDLSEKKILNRLYPFGYTGDFPEKYDDLKIELTVRYIAKRGGEGEVSHSENGVSRNWGSADEEDLLRTLTPHVGVV